MGEIPYTVKRRGGEGGAFAVVFDCPGCGKELGAPLDRAGRDEHCSVCGAMFVCPGRGATARVREIEAEEARADEIGRVRPAIEAVQERAERPFGIPSVGRVTGAETAVVVRRLRMTGGALSLFAAVIVAVLVVFVVILVQSFGRVETGLDAMLILGTLQVCTLWLALAAILFGGARLLEAVAHLTRLLHQRLSDPADSAD